MSSRVRPHPIAPRLAQLTPAIAWLRAQGIGIATIADAFGATTGHVRVLAWRSQRAKPLHVGARIGVRPPDGIGTVSSTSRVERLESQLDTLRLDYEIRRMHDSAGALRALRALRPEIGCPGSTAMTRILARWYTDRAWFAVHSGFTTTALASSIAACRLYHRVFRESGERQDLMYLAEATLIGSHAYLYVSQPEHALLLLTTYRETCAAAGVPLGSDYYRQLGTAYALQANANGGDRDLGHAILARVPVVMARLNETQSADRMAFARRQQHLLGRSIDLDGCHELIRVAERTFPGGAMERVMAANYRAAARLSTKETSHDYADSLEDLEDLRTHALRFPHQEAVRYLLSLTPRLRLSQPVRAAWIRQVFYLNPYRAY